MSEAKYAAQVKSLRKNYVRFSLDFKPDTLAAFRAACEKNGTTPTAVIKSAVADYLRANTPVD